MDETGVVLVNQPHDQIPSRKANIITDALSRSQKNPGEPEKTEDNENFGSLFTLTTHMEMDQEEHHKWSLRTRQTHV